VAEVDNDLCERKKSSLLHSCKLNLNKMLFSLFIIVYGNLRSILMSNLVDASGMSIKKNNSLLHLVFVLVS